jgi:predicted nuclease with TOPRIM domain
MSDESMPEAPQPSEMEMLRAEIRAGFQSFEKRFDDVDKRFDGIDRRFEGVDKRFDGIDKRLDDIDTRLGEHDKRFDEVDKRLVTKDARITDEAAVTRKHFDVVAEGLRESFKVVIDKTMATGEKVDRLIASNAIEHAAFIDGHTDHEVRITRLEAAQGASKPTTS